MSKTRIIMHGCNGKMGQVITRLAEANDHVEIVAGIDLSGLVLNHYPVFTTPFECDVEADVIIDFSTATAVEPLLVFAKQKKLPVVLCTTGLSKESIDELHNDAKEIPIFFSANMSLGVNLIIDLVQRAASLLYSSDFDIEIIEKHHNQKIDSPSGTALAIADAMNDILDEKQAYVYDRHTKREKRTKQEIGIHAVRGGTIVGEHTVLFAGQDEIIEIKHTAMSKEIFAVGSIRAAEFLAHQPPGMYDMNSLLNKA